MFAGNEIPLKWIKYSIITIHEILSFRGRNIKLHKSISKLFFGRINYKLRYYASGVRVQVLVEFFLTNFT